MSTAEKLTYSQQDVLVCIAQAEKYASHPDNGWAVDRRQSAVMAAELCRLLTVEVHRDQLWERVDTARRTAADALDDVEQGKDGDAASTLRALLSELGPDEDTR